MDGLHEPTPAQQAPAQGTMLEESNRMHAQMHHQQLEAIRRQQAAQLAAHQQQQQLQANQTMPSLEGPSMQHATASTPYLPAPSSSHEYSDSPSIKVEIPSVPSPAINNTAVQAPPPPQMQYSAAAASAPLGGLPSSAAAPSPYAFGPAGGPGSQAAPVPIPGTFANLQGARRSRPPSGMTAAKKPMEIAALREIGFEEKPLVADDLYTVEPGDEAAVKEWMMKMELVNPALRKAQEVKNEYTSAVHIQMCSSVYACKCGSIKFGQKLKTVQHVKKKHVDRPRRMQQHAPPSSSSSYHSSPAPSAAPASASHDGDAFSMSPSDLKKYVKAMDSTQLAAFAAMYGLSPEEALDIAGVKPEDSAATAPSGSEQVKMEDAADARKTTCSYCGQTSDHLLQCSACMNAIYCSHTCQKHHWRAHKPDCKKTQDSAANSTDASKPAAPIVSANGLPMPRIPPASAAGANLFQTEPLVLLTPVASAGGGAKTNSPPPSSVPLAQNFGAPISSPSLLKKNSLSAAAAANGDGASPPSSSDALLLELQIWKDEALRLRRGKSRLETKKRKSAAQETTEKGDAAMLSDALQVAMASLQEWRSTFGSNDPHEAIKYYIKRSPDECAEIQAKSSLQADALPAVAAAPAAVIADATAMVDVLPSQPSVHYPQPTHAAVAAQHAYNPLSFQMPYAQPFPNGAMYPAVQQFPFAMHGMAIPAVMATVAPPVAAPHPPESDSPDEQEEEADQPPEQPPANPNKRVRREPSRLQD